MAYGAFEPYAALLSQQQNMNRGTGQPTSPNDYNPYARRFELPRMSVAEAVGALGLKKKRSTK